VVEFLGGREHSARARASRTGSGFRHGTIVAHGDQRWAGHGVGFLVLALRGDRLALSCWPQLTLTRRGVAEESDTSRVRQGADGGCSSHHAVTCSSHNHKILACQSPFHKPTVRCPGWRSIASRLSLTRFVRTLSEDPATCVSPSPDAHGSRCTLQLYRARLLMCCIDTDCRILPPPRMQGWVQGAVHAIAPHAIDLIEDDEDPILTMCVSSLRLRPFER
jgi:hypothetical protein